MIPSQLRGAIPLPTAYECDCSRDWAAVRLIGGSQNTRKALSFDLLARLHRMGAWVGIEDFELDYRENGEFLGFTFKCESATLRELAVKRLAEELFIRGVRWQDS